MFPMVRLSALASFVALQAVKVAEAIPQGEPTSPAGDNGSGMSCNNSPGLCSRQYNQVSHFGAHNSAFLRDESTNNSLAGNQYLNATIALDAGLRLLQAQVHQEDGALRLCHSSCQLLDAGLLQDWLGAVNVWMGENPNDVVTVLLVNADGQPADAFGAAFDASGLSQYGYTPTSSSATTEWPTLQSMINEGTRLVSFIASIEPSTAHPYLLNEFDYMFETHFAVTELDGFNCTVDRPEAAREATTALDNGYLSFVNHFKYQTFASIIMMPDVTTLDVVNSPDTTEEGNLGRHVQACTAEWVRAPNFVMVDFWNQAGPIAAVDELNQLEDVTGRLTVSSEMVQEEEEEEGDSGDSGDSRDRNGGETEAGDVPSSAGKHVAMFRYSILLTSLLLMRYL